MGGATTLPRNPPPETGYAGFLLDGAETPLAGSNPNRLFNGFDEDVPIAGRAGHRRVQDGAHYGVPLLVRPEPLDAQFRDERHGVGASAKEGLVHASVTGSLHREHRESAHSDHQQPFDNGVELFLANDCLHLHHRRSIRSG